LNDWKRLFFIVFIASTYWWVVGQKMEKTEREGIILIFRRMRINKE